MDKEQELIQLLEKYNQDHIIKLLKKIDGAKRKELIEQIGNIDFDQIMELY